MRVGHNGRVRTAGPNLGTGPVVGRAAEVHALAVALADPRCGGVALVGGPGFGKTRLAEHALELARARGMAAAAVRATRSSAGIPFAALASLFAELGTDPSIGSELVGAVAAAVDDRRGDQRLALMVDDAHELDTGSVGLLDQLVQRASIFIVFTVRTGEEGADRVVEMWKDERIARVEVGPISESDLVSLATRAIGEPVERATLRATVTACGGNALFLRELIEGAKESGALVPDLGLWRLTGPLAHSPRLRDLIEQRLGGLSRSEREALELVALGEPLRVSWTEGLVDPLALEQLEERHLLDVVAGEQGPELRLDHPLYGEVVRTNLPSLRRRRLCCSLADAAEAVGEVPEGMALRVAVWRLDGGGGGRFENNITAARAALHGQDYGLALRLGEAVADQRPCVEAALVVGEALDLLGRCDEAERVFSAAGPLAATDRQRTNLAVRRAAVLFRSLGEAEQSDRVLTEVAGTVAEPSCLRDISALRGLNLLFAGRVTEAIGLDEELLRQPGDAAFAQASLHVGTGLALAGRTTEAIAHTGDALAATSHLDQDELPATTGIYLVAHALANLYSGRLSEAHAIGVAGYEASADHRNIDGQAWFASILGLVLLAMGRPVSSVGLFRESARHFGALNHPGRRWALGGVALASSQVGDADTGTAALDELDGLAPTSVHLMDVAIVRGRAGVARCRGDVTSARKLLWEAFGLAQRWGQHATAAEALHDLLRMGSAPGAAELLGELSTLVDGDLMEGRVLLARAVTEGAPGPAGLAADRFAAVGAQLFAAEAAALESRLSAGEGLRRRSAAAAARSASLRAGCEGARTPMLERSESTERLTEREQEVVRLAADGLASRQIADRLYLSVRTVENHLQRAYVKLGVTSRVELAQHLREG